ncbi:MAG: thiosulfate oxidation carrier protein SoxY [Xanthomonadales bacterium]|nr:thiosulfate oxidation carrier protein SoxY [Xanthomonadales bacterium]
MEVSTTRRGFIKGLIAVGTLLALPATLLAAMVRPKAAFGSKEIDASLKSLFGDASIEASDKVYLKVPEIAENSAVVPITITTDIEDVESISVIIDKNPNPLSANFKLTDAVAPEVSARVKMGQSSPVRALVKAKGKVYFTTKEVKVTIGGCGG